MDHRERCAEAEHGAECAFKQTRWAVGHPGKIMSSRPCDTVNVVANEPACNAPCSAPAAPPSLCISITVGTVPQILGFCPAGHWSALAAPPAPSRFQS